MQGVLDELAARGQTPTTEMVEGLSVLAEAFEAMAEGVFLLRSTSAASILGLDLKRDWRLRPGYVVFIPRAISEVQL